LRCEAPSQLLDTGLYNITLAFEFNVGELSTTVSLSSGSPAGQMLIYCGVGLPNSSEMIPQFPVKMDCI
jgi:hypothetical protein